MEPYNFSRHLRDIVKPCLKDDGFVMKSTKFTRKTELYDECINFQRSQHNIAGYGPSTFYLNIGIETPTDKFLKYARFDRPTMLSKPSFLIHIDQGKTPMERKNMVEMLSDLQKSEMKKYYESIQWHYSTESELSELFTEAASLLKSQLNLFFGEVRKQFPSGVEPLFLLNLADKCNRDFNMTVL